MRDFTGRSVQSLNSFIMLNTRLSDMRMWWDNERPAREKQTNTHLIMTYLWKLGSEKY